MFYGFSRAFGAENVALADDLVLITMSESDQARLKLIQDHPISTGLDAFRSSVRHTTDSDIDQLTTDGESPLLFVRRPH